MDSRCSGIGKAICWYRQMSEAASCTGDSSNAAVSAGAATRPTSEGGLDGRVVRWLGKDRKVLEGRYQAGQRDGSWAA